MVAGEAALDVVAVALDVVLDLLADRYARLLDRGVALAHRSGAEVGVCAGAVPVAFDRLGVEGDDHVVVLGDAVQQPAGDIEMVADGQRVGCADLELPLAGHDLGVGALDQQTGVDARLGVLFDDLAADDAAGADAAVVRPLRCGEAVVGEAERCAVELEHRVLLLDAEDHALLGVLLVGLLQSGAGVGGVRLHVRGQQHFAQHEHIRAATNRIGTREDGLEHAVAVCTIGLIRRRTVEAPDRKRRHLVFDDLGLRTKQRRRFVAVDPDVFSLIGH